MHFVAAAILAFWILALVTTVLNLATAPRLTAAAHPSREPLVSIIVPARNEARTIERTVRALLAQTYSAFEVIVVNDRSGDETGAVVRSIVDPRLTLIDGQEPAADWLGKPWALHQGSGRARGELLLFVDADVIYAPPVLRSAVAYLESSGAAMITLFPHFEMRGFAENAAMPMPAFTGFTLLPLWLSNRTHFVSLAIGGGSGNLIRRGEFEAMGRFVPLRSAVVDDVALAQLARQHRFSTRAVRADDFISVRMYHGAREIINGFCKNAFVILGHNFGLAAVMMLLLFVFHLLPYGLAATGEAISLATVLIISLTRVILFRSLRYRLDNAIALHPVMVLFWAFIFLRSMWMTSIRRQLVWRGRTYDATRTRFGPQR